MGQRETAAQRKTRIGMLLADYDARNRELNKLTTIVKGLKEQIRAEVTPGTYGDMVFAFGNTREMFDQATAKRLLAEAGIPIPMTETQPSLVVTPRAK